MASERPDVWEAPLRRRPHTPVVGPDGRTLLPKDPVSAQGVALVYSLSSPLEVGLVVLWVGAQGLRGHGFCPLYLRSCWVGTQSHRTPALCTLLSQPCPRRAASRSCTPGVRRPARPLSSCLPSVYEDNTVDSFIVHTRTEHLLCAFQVLGMQQMISQHAPLHEEVSSSSLS